MYIIELAFTIAIDVNSYTKGQLIYDWLAVLTRWPKSLRICTLGNLHWNKPTSHLPCSLTTTFSYLKHEFSIRHGSLSCPFLGQYHLDRMQMTKQRRKRTPWHFSAMESFPTESFKMIPIAYPTPETSWVFWYKISSSVALAGIICSEAASHRHKVHFRKTQTRKWCSKNSWNDVVHMVPFCTRTKFDVLTLYGVWFSRRKRINYGTSSVFF